MGDRGIKMAQSQNLTFRNKWADIAYHGWVMALRVDCGSATLSRLWWCPMLSLFTEAWSRSSYCVAVVKAARHLPRKTYQQFLDLVKSDQSSTTTCYRRQLRNIPVRRRISTLYTSTDVVDSAVDVFYVTVLCNSTFAYLLTTCQLFYYTRYYLADLVFSGNNWAKKLMQHMLWIM